MADVELVIKVPEEVYEEIKNGMDIELHFGDHIVVKDEWASERIRNGTPLPKGHGRLIDARDFGRIPTIIEANEVEPLINGDWHYGSEPMQNISYSDRTTIIETDKESENANSN